MKIVKSKKKRMITDYNQESLNQPTSFILLQPSRPKADLEPTRRSILRLS